MEEAGQETGEEEEKAGFNHVILLQCTVLWKKYIMKQFRFCLVMKLHRQLC